MTTSEFLKTFKDSLKKQLNWYEFDVGKCKDWIENIIEYYKDIFEQVSNNKLSKEDAIATVESDKFDEADIIWPNSAGAERITKKAYRNDPEHFNFILNYYGLDNDPKNYFISEWKYNIKPEIIDYVTQHINSL